MEPEPVSAFAIYKTFPKPKPAAEKKKKKFKNKKKSKSNARPQQIHEINDNLLKELAQKSKKKQNKEKNSKNIANKQKSHKKKKNKGAKVQNDKNNDTSKGASKEKRKRENISSSPESISDEVPTLVPAPLIYNGHGRPDDDDTCSHSSNGSFDFTPVQTDSVEEGMKVFRWMIAPFSAEEFLNKMWEKKPLHISRSKPKYYNDIISTPLIDDMLRNESIQFTKNIDVTSYVDGKRETHNPEGRAHPHLVWDYYLNGCSVRLLNPQTYMPKLHLLNATLQEFFNSFVGANAYLTPPDSQGFAPHYDDIEAFILQTEGKKHWRVYKPRTENEYLPRVSSENFKQDEIGEPILDIILEAGDMLYFPRGYIHQGITIDGEHSLHVTVSMYQKHSWADLFEKLIPAALQIAINENVELRRGLPFDIYEHFGLVNSDVNTPRKDEIARKIMSLFDRVKDCLPIDAAVDQMNKNYQHDSLPPVLTDLEKAVTVYGDTDVMIENGKVTQRIEIGLDTKIRLLRRNILRMVSEEGQIRLYYYAENSLEYHGNEPPYLEIDENMAPAVETLITSYPEYVSVENLDVASDTDKLQIADALWGRGLIMTEYPLESIDDD